jgi:hypothetical protein
MPTTLTIQGGYHVQVGCILWLPKKKNIDPCLLDDTNLHDGCFHHPVVILSLDEIGKRAIILMVSIIIQRA